MIYTKEIEVFCKADGDMKDITKDVERAIDESKMKNGMACVFVVGSTGAITTIEYEPGLKKDFPQAMERIAPSGIDYEHHKTWGDDNGRSHVRASIVGPSLVVPFLNGKLVTGTWQQIVLINFDTKDRNRRIIIQIMGE
ncbi:MAG: YjbQ family protein [Candidatus Hydrothermarchaeota archaeon]|nr:MAG: YjbQ family protein [Candidatus Hydrothermarchaeota archaeon]